LTEVAAGRLRPTAPQETPVLLADLMKRCSEFRAEDRPEFREVARTLAPEKETTPTVRNNIDPVGTEYIVTNAGPPNEYVNAAEYQAQGNYDNIRGSNQPQQQNDYDNVGANDQQVNGASSFFFSAVTHFFFRVYFAI
jgi:hypothetical protein